MLPLLIWTVAILPAADRACAGEWRGVPLQQALGEVSRRCQVEYLADANLPKDALDREVRLSVKHLTGNQAARWLARLAGLEAVGVEGSLVLATRERAKLIAQELNPQDAANRAKADAAAWNTLKARRAAVNWDQTPLSRVASDVSNWFGVDVIYHPDVLAEPELVTMSRQDADVAQVAAALADQLHATVEFLDGALWVHPAPKAASSAKVTPAPVVPEPSETTRPAEVGAVTPRERQDNVAPAEGPAASGQPKAATGGSITAEPPVPVSNLPVTRPAPAPVAVKQPPTPPVAKEPPPTPAAEPKRPPEPSATPPADLEKALDKPMVLDRSVGNWQELAGRVRQVGGIGCTIQVPAGATYPGLAAEGTIREVLEAGRLLGYISWSVDPPSAKGPGGIRIIVIAKG